MKRQTIDESRKCPKCNIAEYQVNKGFNHSGTQRCLCRKCGIYYTKDPKKQEYSEETKRHAMKIYYSGVSGRGVGKILGMNKANIYNWIKKNESACGKPD
jgi:transposase-like protein